MWPFKREKPADPATAPMASRWCGCYRWDNLWAQAVEERLHPTRLLERQGELCRRDVCLRQNLVQYIPLLEKRPAMPSKGVES